MYSSPGSAGQQHHMLNSVHCLRRPPHRCAASSNEFASMDVHASLQSVLLTSPHLIYLYCSSLMYLYYFARFSIPVDMASVLCSVVRYRHYNTAKVLYYLLYILDCMFWMEYLHHGPFILLCLFCMRITLFALFSEGTASVIITTRYTTTPVKFYTSTTSTYPRAKGNLRMHYGGQR